MAFRRVAYHRSKFLIVVGLIGLASIAGAEALRGLERVGDRRGLAWLARRTKNPDRPT